MNRILVIEDEDLLRENLKEMLELKGHQIILANNGKMGIQKAVEHTPDLIICDIMMPEMDGYEVLRQVRKNTATSETPFIFLTARSEASDTRAGMNLGADDYITKPFLIDDLNKAIQSRLERRKSTLNHIRQKVEESIVRINNISAHEYNTPLNGIVGLTDIMLDFYDDFSKAEMVEMLQAIRKSGKRLQQTITKILMFAHVQKCEQDLAHNPQAYLKADHVHLMPIIEFEAKERSSLYERTADLSMNLIPLQVAIAEEDLKLITGEIIDNAFKFSAPGTRVEISATIKDSVVVIKVTDEGRGMKNDDLAQIGTPFAQFERDKFEQQGIGLGLCLTKKICELYKGNLKISSEYGSFTHVELTLPF